MKDKKVNSINERKESAGFEPLVKVEVAAAMMGLKPPTLYGWIETGRFEGLKIGKKAVRVRPEAVRQFLQAALKEAESNVRAA